MIDLSATCLAQALELGHALAWLVAITAFLPVAVKVSREVRKWCDIIGPVPSHRGRREASSGRREPPSRPRIVVLVNDEMWRPIPYAVIRETDGRDHAPESPWVFILPERLVGKRVSIWDELADRHIKNDILRRNLDGLYRIVVAGPSKSNEG